MWNAVYIDGQAKSIDVSSTRTDACFYLDVGGTQMSVLRITEMYSD